MAQTALTVTAAVQNNISVAAGALAVTMAAADTTNGNSFTSTGREILLIQNTDSSAHSITITSVADGFGRTDTSLTGYSIAANSISAIECAFMNGWKQTDGTIHLTSTSALIFFGVLRF